MRTNKGKKKADAMARSFWEFIRVEKNIEMCDRDHVSICFREYIAKTTFAPQDNVNANANHSMIRNNTRKRNTALEAQTLARMRQLRLAKTIRADNYTVLAMFCHPQDRKFPSKDDQTRKKNELKSDLENAKENKEGVIVSELPDRVTGSIGEMEILQFHIEEEVPGAWDGGSRKLIGLEIRGSHGHKFQLSSTIPTLPLNIFESADVAITVTPQKIGVMRAKVIFIFESFVISRAITMSCGHAEMNRVLQPTSPYKRKRRARVVTYPSKENTVGPPPKQEGARSNTENNPFQNLNHYQVPIEVHKAIRDGTYDDDVEQTGWRTSSGHDSLNGYGNYWKHLLWAQESQANRDIQMYDMDHVRLKKEGRLYLLTVPGLAESRPSVLRGDLVHITFNGCLYKGRVVVIRQLEVVLDLHSKFSQTYSPGIDHVSVHFTFSRMTYRTCHKACEEMGAEQAMGARMLIPTKENISGMMEHACPICFDQLGGAGNAPFTTTYCRGQCGADFHETCIQRWLGQEQHQANPTCPTCREPWVEGTATNDRPIGGDSNKNVTLVPWANRGLNPEQQQAVQRVANGTLRPLPYVIFGPPGTGKTTTVVETIYQLGKKGKRILLVAPSNDAADILVERLASYFPPSELRRILAYSRGIDTLPTSIRSYANELLDSEQQVAEILPAQIVVSTVNLAAKFSYWGIPRCHFEVLCVDEAGHATEPEVVAVASSLMGFKESSSTIGQLILAGDPKQLGPITGSDICLKYGLNVSYMERLTERSVYKPNEDKGKYPEDLLTKLVRNYRSHPSILKLPNDMFYKDLQCCGDRMVTSNLVRWEHLPKQGFPVFFHAMDGENLREGNSPSWFNPEEAQQAVEYVRLLIHETRPPLQADEIGIITPYARQAQKIRLALKTQNMDDVKVGSVETFQGQERRAIIISTVRAEREQVNSDIRYNLGFVANPKRFNVAITRAKALLIVIGSPSVLAMDKASWLPFMKYCHENNSWTGEEWDPASAVDEEEDDNEVAGATSMLSRLLLGESSSSDDDEEAPSQAALQEGFVFVNHEE